MRHVKPRPGEPVDASALRALVETAYADMRVRLGASCGAAQGSRLHST
jgi:hypothetical protein